MLLNYMFFMLRHDESHSYRYDEARNIDFTEGKLIFLNNSSTFSHDNNIFFMNERVYCLQLT